SVFQVDIDVAGRDGRQRPDGSKVERLMEGANIGRAVTEEAYRNVLCALVLRAPGSATRDRKMRTDDGIRTHDPVVDRCQMHRAAFTAHQAIVALHQFA